ncbi:MAG: glycosyltransferase family 2 protein [Bacteroidetes bacterium]|nr:glycosyltransferase family 2 protein [Bacteroidota bacterium]MBP6316246.1 glycosyltransferase family 2 protein [Chitinophagaceae bacterium]
MRFSILIPTQNNLSSLKCCIDSIQTHSTFQHEILVHVSDLSKEVFEYLVAKEIEFIASPFQIDRARAYNTLFSKVSSEYIICFTDSMRCHTKWDFHLAEEMSKSNSIHATICTHLQRINCDQPFESVFGTQEIDRIAGLYKFLSKKIQKYFWQKTVGAYLAPYIVHKEIWEKLNGLNALYLSYEGMHVDFHIRMQLAGISIFRTAENSIIEIGPDPDFFLEINKVDVSLLKKVHGIRFQQMKRIYVKRNDASGYMSTI